MTSDALKDFQVRKDEFDALLTVARDSRDPTAAAMYSKCAIVLACAALERYMDDVIKEVCRNFDEQTWTDLSEGRQRYLLRHMALKMSERANVFIEKNRVVESDCEHLAEFVRTCGIALDNPSTWMYFSDFGIFGEGTNAPNKIDAVLKAFDSDGRSLYKFIEDFGEDIGLLLRNLQQLVDARHSAAHAKKGADSPGPSDASVWVGCAVTMAEKVDEFLRF